MSDNADVAVFTAESQVKEPFKVLAKISFTDWGKFHVMSLKDSFEPLKAKAREIGANGVIIDHSETVYSGIFSRGISVEARAIHVESAPTASFGKNFDECFARCQQLTDRTKDQCFDACNH